MARVETAKSLENMVNSERRKRTVDNRFLGFLTERRLGTAREQETKSTETNPTPHGDTTPDRTGERRAADRSIEIHLIHSDN